MYEQRTQRQRFCGKRTQRFLALRDIPAQRGKGLHMTVFGRVLLQLLPGTCGSLPRRHTGGNVGTHTGDKDHARKDSDQRRSDRTNAFAQRLFLCPVKMFRRPRAQEQPCIDGRCSFGAYGFP